jgi:hypothetical protein
MVSSETENFSSYRSGPSPETTDSTQNQASDTDLGHSESSFREITDLLSNDFNGEITAEDGRVFGKESGDDQGVHESGELETLVAFHLATAGIMSEKTGFYQEAREEDLSLEKTVERVEEKAGCDPRNIMQGAYSTAKVVSQLPKLVKRKPGAISAEHSSPVRHGDEVEINQEASGADIPLVKYQDGSEGEVYAEHGIIDEAEEDVDYDLMAYALAKGMSFEDRNGDVLFGFPEIRFTDYEWENLEELVMAERSLVEDSGELEYAGDEVLAGAEKMESQFQGMIDEDVEVNVYNNVLKDQEGEKVIEYAEMDLQGVEYPEAAGDVSGDVGDFFRASSELGRKTAEFYGSWMRAGMQANPFIPTATSSR